MKKLSLILSVVMMTAMMLSSCGGGVSTEVTTSTEVTIGKQVWMIENLNVDKFRNGDIIPEAKTKEEWNEATKNNQPAWCYYNNNPDNGDKYGKLYNWHAVNDSRGLAPEGWKIPTYEEWTRLIDFLGGQEIAVKKMKSADFWADGKNGTNESEFSALPSGYRYYPDYSAPFMEIGKNSIWWHSTHYEQNEEMPGYIDWPSGTVGDFINKGNGFSVRCLKI